MVVQIIAGNFELNDKNRKIRDTSDAGNAYIFSWQISGEARKEEVRELRNVYTPGTFVDKSCSFVLNGKMYVTGGNPDYYQISVLDGCNLVRLDRDLPVDSDAGLCTSYRNNTMAMFCDGNECWNFYEDKFEQVADMLDWHAQGFKIIFLNPPTAGIFLVPTSEKVIIYNVSRFGLCEYIPEEKRVKN